jgi:hypothetical protein
LFTPRWTDWFRPAARSFVRYCNFGNIDCSLRAQEKTKACEICRDAGVDFVKTSPGERFRPDAQDCGRISRIRHFWLQLGLWWMQVPNVSARRTELPSCTQKQKSTECVKFGECCTSSLL